MADKLPDPPQSLFIRGCIYLALAASAAAASVLITLILLRATFYAWGIF